MSGTTTRPQRAPAPVEDDGTDLRLIDLAAGLAQMGASALSKLVVEVRVERLADKAKLRTQLDAEALLRRAEAAEAERDDARVKLERARDAVKEA